MQRWLSLTKVLTVVLFGFAGLVAFRSGWIPLEFGGTQTGSVVDADLPRGATDAGALPEFEADDAAQQLDVCGFPAGVLSEQTEPTSEEVTSAVTRGASKRDALVEADESAAGNAVPPAVAERSYGRMRSKLRLVAGEQPAKGDPPAETSEPPAVDSVDEPPVRIAKRPNDVEPSLDLTEIDRQFKAGQFLEAHQALSKIYWQQPELRSRIQERIDATAKVIYFSPQPHVQEPYVVQAGDQLRKIAAKHHVPWPFLAKLNRTDPRRLREGQKLKVIDGPFGAVVTLSDFELVLHHHGQYVRGYRICIGKDGSSPVGKFKVLNKVTNPQYTDPDGKVFAGDDPKNPLGNVWIDLGESYGIHGTIEPNSIGKAESRGCIRLLNADAAEVFDTLEVGSEVVIRP